MSVINGAVSSHSNVTS